MSLKRNRYEEVEALYQLASKLLHLENYDEILDLIVESTLSLLQADRGFLVLTQGETFEFKVVRNWKRSELESGEERISRTILQETLQSNQPLMIEDALEDIRFAEQKSVRGLQIRSVLAAPLSIEGKVVGALYLESRSIKNLFGSADLSLFTELLNLSSRAINNCVKRIVLQERNALLEKDLLARYRFPGIVTQDTNLLDVLKMVGRVSSSDLPILIQGKSGTGKELIARSVYLNSRRAKQAFVVINCGAISPALLESELFGHVRGAFTGAVSHKTGLIESADRGTLFLDEIGELPKELQVKLLRLLQFGEIQSVGSTKVKTVDVRFIAATNRDLKEEVKEKRFREDLLYRLNAVVVELPSLKERPGDILPLFHHFIKITAQKEKRKIPRVTQKLERVLQQFEWPGNVRELENEAKRLLALTPASDSLTIEYLSPRILETSVETTNLLSLAEREKELIELHLRAAGGNRTHAAKSLGITREGLRQKMKRFELA